MAKVTKSQVDRAFKKAKRAELDQKISALRGKLVTESNTAKKAMMRAQIKQLQYERDRIRVRKANGNGSKKKGLF